MEPNNEVKVGTGVQLLSIVRSPSSSEPTIWFAQVPASCVVSDVTRFVSNVGRKGVRRRGLKPLPKYPEKKLFTHSYPEHFMFRSLYKEVSFTVILLQSFISTKMLNCLSNFRVFFP